MLLGCATAPSRVFTADACPSDSEPVVLIGNAAAPPAWVWIAEDEFLAIWRTTMFGKKIALAPPEVLASWGPPPCGVPLSRLHAGEERPMADAWTFLGVLGIVLQGLGAALR